MENLRKLNKGVWINPDGTPTYTFSRFVDKFILKVESIEKKLIDLERRVTDLEVVNDEKTITE